MLLHGGYFDIEESAAKVRLLTEHIPAEHGRDLQVALINYFVYEMPISAHRLMSPTMAHGVEARLPYLDPDLVDFVINLPIEWKVRVPRLGIKPVPKYILKRLAERYLPRSLLYRPKMGFHIPGDRYIGDLPARWLEEGALVARLGLAPSTVRDWYGDPRTARDRFFFGTAEIWAQLFWLGRSVEDVESEYLAANH
jgi:asparagine synthetase B (glutamine-hydrolysing)